MCIIHMVLNKSKCALYQGRKFLWIHDIILSIIFVLKNSWIAILTVLNCNGRQISRLKFSQIHEIFTSEIFICIACKDIEQYQPLECLQINKPHKANLVAIHTDHFTLYCILLNMENKLYLYVCTCRDISLEKQNGSHNTPRCRQQCMCICPE